MLTLEQVQNKSASKIAGLLPVVKQAASVLVSECYKRGVYIQITQGLRTIEEQNALYAQGRNGDTRDIVTNAKGGYSNHNFGVALDFALLSDDGKRVSWDTNKRTTKEAKSDWSIVVEIAKSLGFSWGGDWKSFKDYPHFEMTFGLSTAQFRAGKRPAKALLDRVFANLEKFLDKEDDLDMSTAADLQKQISDLKQQVAALTNSKEVLKDATQDQAQSALNLDKRLSALEKLHNMDIPVWAKEGVQALVDKKVIDTPDSGSFDFYRFVKILKQLNLV
ncbi:Peptidoglycan L-alanyl-D-glutamate endopeptidase CwlK precursor [compost metagenome]